VKNRVNMMVVLFSLVISFLAAGCRSGSDTSGPIRIGQTVALTGERTSIGEYLAAGAKMAVDEINAAGGIKGRKVELIQEDSDDTNPAMVNAYNKVLSAKPVAILCNDVSTQNLAIAAIANKEKMPTFVGGTSPVLLQGNDWFFRFRPSDVLAAQASARFAVQTLGKKKVAIAHLTDDFGMAGRNFLTKYVTDFGGTVVSDESYNRLDRDFTAQLENIRKSGAEVIINWADTYTAATMMRQNKQLGINLPLIGSAAHGTPTTSKLAGEAAYGVYVVMDGVVAQVKDPKAEEWVKRFKQRYNKEPEFNATAAYDAIFLIKQAIENANGATDNESIKKGISAIRGYSGIANIFKYENNGEGPRQVVIAQIQANGPIVKEAVKTE